jgi:DNA repair exonuclease SbcCD ATPase subunit
MWYPERLKLVNFMSHRDSEFVFERGVATMVYGVNKSDEGAVSNGSGKSAILEGISVALINASLRKSSTKDLVTDGEIESTQYLSLSNPVLDQKLEITRTIFSNSKSGKLSILLNGEEPNIDLTNVDDGNKYILSQIGIAREDLLNYFLISKEKYEPFLGISDTKKKAIIARFSQATLIDPAFTELDQEIDVINEELEAYDRQQDVINGKIEVYESEINSFSMDELEQARSNKIEAFKTTHDSNKNKVQEETDCIELLKPSVKELQDEIKDIESVDYAEEIKSLELKLKDNSNTIFEEREELNGLIELETKVRKGLLDAVKCPSCSHEFSIANEKLNVEKARDRHGAIKGAIKEVEESIQQLNKKKGLINSEIGDYETKSSEFRKKRRDLETRLSSIERTIERHEINISNLQKDNLSVTKAIQDLREKQIEDKRVEFKSQIKKLNSKIASIVESAETAIKLKEKKSHLKQTMTKFKTYLANKAIGAIEANANEYLQNTKTNLSVQIDGYKMTRTGKLRENITATILRDGLAAGSYTRLSSGEKARIEISIIMALQKLINGSADHGKGMDLTWLDEVIESVDNSGIGGIMKSLNSIDQTIVVITHGTFDEVYPHTVSVIKEDNVSNIVYGEQ